MPATQLLGIGGQGVELQLTDFDKRLLSRFRAETVYGRFGLQRGIPLHGGKAISFRRMESLFSTGNAGPAAAGSAPTALVEGTPPAMIDATWTQVLCTVSQYGQFLLVSDLSEDQSIDTVVPETTENFSEAMTDALDLITRDVLVAGTTVRCLKWAA
jgi:N4-gp56 family major capsid protein